MSDLGITKSKICIESEIAPLKKVLIHTPGPEIECMAPDEVEKYLFNALIFQRNLIKDYTIFKNVLSKFAKVYEVKDCLIQVFSNVQVREHCLNKVLNFYEKLEFKHELLNLDVHELVRVLIEGLEYKKSRIPNSFSSFVSSDRYILSPLPNLYFTRDTSIVIGTKVASAYMAQSVRYVEMILTRAIFKYHPDFKGEGFLCDSFFPDSEDPPAIKFEGGDVHIWEKNLYLIGVSARTNSSAIDAFVNALAQDRKAKMDDEPFYILAVLLPDNPSMIHLDMLFTQVSKHHALVYKPVISGSHPFSTIKISANSSGIIQIEEMHDLLSALKSVNYDIEPIFCGHNQSLIVQQREQAVSGTNSFALAPGKIISYDNEHTIRALEHAGFKSVAGQDFVGKFELYQSQDNIVITIDGSQLSQGGGGPRCMTCPILRSY